MAARSTAEVLGEHLRRREQGDLEHNYAQEVVLLCEHGALEGRDGIHSFAKALMDQLPAARFEYPVKAIASEHALLHWHAISANARVDLGVDTFLIHNGRIVLQTVSYQLKRES
jgi:hypothetical protein